MRTKLFFYFFTIIFFFGINNSYAQQTEDVKALIDSAELYINSKAYLSIQYLNDALPLARKNNEYSSLVSIYNLFFKIFDDENNSEKSHKFLLLKIESLKKLRAQSPSDTLIIKELYFSQKKLALHHESIQELHQALRIYEQMLALTIELQNKMLEAETYRLIGSCFHFQDDYDNSRLNYKTSLNIYKELSAKENIFSLLLLYGAVNFEDGKYEQAIDNYYESLDIAIELQNKEFQHIVHMKMSEVFYKLNLFDKAIDENEKSIEIILNSQDTSMVGLSFLMHGNIYFDMKKYETALYYFKKSLLYFNAPEYLDKSAYAYNGIGKSLLMLGNYKDAEVNIVLALKIREKRKRQKDLADSYIWLGEYHKYTENYKKAKLYLTLGLKLSEKINNLSYISIDALKLSELYSIDSIYDKAYEFHVLYKKYSDSLISQKNIEIISKNEFYRKHKLEDLKKNLKLKEQRNNNIKLFSAITILLILLIIIVILLKRSQKNNKKLIAQKFKIELQNRTIKSQFERAEKLSIVASHTENSVMIMDKNGKFEWVNKGFSKMYGLTLEKLIEKRGDNLSEASFYEHIDIVIKQCITKRQTIRYEFQNIYLDKVQWIQSTLTPIIEDNQIVKLIAIHSDITKVKAAWEKIRKQNAEMESQSNLLGIYNSELKAQKLAIAESNQNLTHQHEELHTQTEQLKTVNEELAKLSIVASKTDNSIYIFTIDGELKWTNDAFTRHTGYTYQEFIYEFGSNMIEASTNPNIEDDYFECINSKKPITYTSEFRTKFGKKIWLQTTLTPIITDKDDIEQVIAIDTDVTKIKEAEAKIFQQNSEIKSSIQYASRIQKAILPMTIFVNALFENYFILYKPRDIVSGDFYWTAYKNDKTIAVAADCTGHGIPGAFMSVLGMMSFNTVISKVKEIKADEILNLMRETIINLLHQRGKKDEANDGMDVAICIFDFENNILEYAGANSPLYIVRNNDETNNPKLKRIKPDKMSIDFNPLRPGLFTAHSIHFKKGDMFYMASDGYIDQFGGDNNKKFLRANFEKLLLKIYHKPLYKQKEILNLALENWRGEIEQVDDILVFGIQT